MSFVNGYIFIIEFCVSFITRFIMLYIVNCVLDMFFSLNFYVLFEGVPWLMAS